MIPVEQEAIVDAYLIMNQYREALSAALTEAGLDYPITSDGSESGFDAVVLSTMEPAAYSVAVTDTAILVRAGHYLALEDAFREILAGRGLDGESFTGEYDGGVPLTQEEMVLVWNDEFDGEGLDLSKWALNAQMHVSDVFNGSEERNVTVTDGNLLLRSWKEEDMPGYVYSTNTSVTTDGTLSYKYGYLEMSAIVPYVRGAFPSFWMLGSDLHRTSAYRAEVDILEVFGSLNIGYAMLHKARMEPDFVNFASDRYSEFDRRFQFRASKIEALKTDYHRYGFGWTPTEMYFTMDGEVYFTHDITEAGNFGEGDMSCFHDPLYIILNNFIYSPGFAGSTPPSDDTEFPIEYRVDWVRLYQVPGEGELHYDIFNGKDMS